MNVDSAQAEMVARLAEVYTVCNIIRNHAIQLKYQEFRERSYFGNTHE